MTVFVYTGGTEVALYHSAPPPLPLPVVDSFTAAPSVITVGANIVLAWTTTDADSVTIDNGIGVQPADGSIVVTPAASGTYHLTAIGPGGTAQASVSVSVNPVVVPSGKMPVIGPSRFHSQQAWQADWIDATVAAGRALPWTLGADLPNGILARSRNGVAPTNPQAWHVWGNPTELYSEIPYFDPAGRSHPYNSEVGDDFAQIVSNLHALPPSAGARGLAMPLSYVTAIPHPTFTLSGNVIPRHPLVIWIRHDAMMQLGYADGSMQNLGFIPGIMHSHDGCIDGRFIMFVCDIGVKNASTNVWSGGRIARVDRQPGSVGTGGTPAEDTTKYDVTTFASAGYPTAVRVDENHNVYFIDADKNGEITKVAPGGTPVALCNVPKAFALDYAHGKLYVMTRTNEIHICDATTGVVGPNLMPAQYIMADSVRGGDFYTISVDANGTCGPIGEFSCSRVHTTANKNAWQFSADGLTVRFSDGIYGPSGHSWQTIGKAYNVHELFGHYDWLGGKYHVDQAVRFVGGYANCPTGVIVLDPTTPSGQPYPAQADVDYTAVYRGMKILCQGGPVDDKARPALTCLMSREGWSMFAGCSNDEIAEMSFDAAEAWIHGGYAGSFRRDDIVGNDLYCLMLMHLVGSQRWLREGTAALTAFKAWWTSKGRPFPPSPASTVSAKFNDYPLSQHNDGNGDPYHLEVRETAPGAYRIGIFGNSSADQKYLSGGPAQGEYTGVVGNVPADAVIIVDKGMPNQTTLPGNLTFGWHAFTVQAAGWATNAVTYKVPG